MRVRRLGPGDGATFRRIRLEALETEPEAYASRLSDWTGLSDAEWEARIARGIVVVAVDADESPIGLMGVIADGAGKTAHRGHLVMVYVGPGHRGRGVARALLDRTETEARASGFLQLELHVAGRNQPAVEFYRRSGYDVIGRVPRAMREQDAFVDDLIMMRRLDA